MVKKYSTFFYILLISFAVSAGVLMLIPLGEALPDTVGDRITLVIGALFWAGLIVSVVMTVQLSAMRRKLEERIPALKAKTKQSFPGVITFSKKPEHLCVYALFVVCLLVTISEVVFTYLPSFVGFPMVGLAYFTFALHCIIDGKCFKAFIILKKSSKRDPKASSKA